MKYCAALRSFGEHFAFISENTVWSFSSVISSQRQRRNLSLLYGRLYEGGRARSIRAVCQPKAYIICVSRSEDMYVRSVDHAIVASVLREKRLAR